MHTELGFNHRRRHRMAGRPSGVEHETRGVEFVSKSDRDQKIEDRDPKCAVGFVGTPVLPGEDQEEFEGLQEEFYLQYEPLGPLEELAADTMAAAVWRIRHIGIFQEAV
jgi:hypothetical protein